MSRRRRISADEARRIAFAAQGFDRERPKNPSDIRAFRRAMRAITVLQLDYVNVLIPAHFLMLWSRLGPYDRQRFESWLYGCREFTEQWAHEASVVAREDWPLLAHRRAHFEMHKNSPIHQLRNRKQYLSDVLEQVKNQGAVTSNDLPPAPGVKRNPGDWHRSIPRCALEQHFGTGKLAVRRRRANFQREYDLPERLIAEELRQHSVTRADAHRELVRKSAAALGVATIKDLADYYRITANEARSCVRELVAEGGLQEVQVEGWNDAAYLSRNARAPRKIGGASILSPFDPMVWFRPRAERLFRFEYRIEIYVPAPKRRWGYYVLPFREGDKLTARVDLKADRVNSVLLVQAAYAEPCFDPDTTAARLARELRALADWQGLQSIAVQKASAFDKALAAEL